MIDQFLSYLRYERNRSELTIERYGKSLRLFQAFFEEQCEGQTWETVDADITEWFVKSPTPIATQAVAEGWEGDKFGDASDGVSEYWNKAAATFHQTITLPAGDYKLTVVALQRTNMAGVVYAGDAQKTIAQATTDEANSRGQAAAWFNAGNGVNEVKFTMAEAGEIEIGLITDNTTGDHWTVWQSFKIEKLAPVPPVAFTVTPNIASGTQAEFTTVEAGTALKLTVSTENLSESITINVPMGEIA